jgi:hypothetical protein
MNEFLPDNYSIPKPPSGYMKLEEGLNSIRILSSAITGYEYWNTDNKPVRSRECWDEIPDDIKLNQQSQAKINHFWIFVVWNYKLSKVQILELTQSSIQKAIKALVANPKWGNPKMYDIAITKIVENGKTSYSIQGEPPISKPSEEIEEAYNKQHINLDALYEGLDPFAKN